MLTPRPDGATLCGPNTEAAVTELERARAHLRNCQSNLQIARTRQPNCIPMSESCVLAALSWVWSEQEKAAGRDVVMLGDSSYRLLNAVVIPIR